MNRIIEYFVKNSRLNYTLLVFILVMGVFAYVKIPKEMFPTVTLDAIMVTGNYSGASADNLNNFAVVELENQIDTISGIDEVTTTVTNGSFAIKIELQDGADKDEVQTDVENAISVAKKYLPSDMDDPSISNVKRQGSLINISISSKEKDKVELFNISDKLKTQLLQIPNVSEVSVFGDSDLQIDIVLDHKKIDMYSIESSSVISAIQNLTYMYPVAQIEKTGEHLYVTANNTDKFDKDVWLNTMLKVDGKNVYLKDIASITIDYPSDETISRLNGKSTISLEVYKNSDGDAISMAKKIKTILATFEKANPEITMSPYHDSAKRVDDRLKTIIANITLGLILVGLSMHFLISPRLSFVIILGIPTSFIIGIVIIEQMGYSLNLISLMAMLMSLGIVVDDAIIVSENIQRHLDEGSSLHEAVINGTKEVVAPVLVAAATTVFAFLPMMLISGEFGLLIILVPIVVSILILSSLIESFIFLPLHAKHLLRANDKMLDWTPVYNFYENILHKTIHYKKTFLVIFFITVPLITFYLISISRFQMMPDKDTNKITLSFKLDESSSLEQTDVLTKKYEDILLTNSKKLFIKNLSTTVGRFTDVGRNSETIENGFTLALELEDLKSENFLDKYVNPVLNLSFDFKQETKIRDLDANEVRSKVRDLITPQTKIDKVVEFNIIKDRIGIVKTDVEIKLSSEDTLLLLKNIKKLKESLAKVEGTKDIADNTNLGEPEYKFTLNSYAHSLGLTDSEVSSQIANLFIEKEQANTFNKDGVIKIKTQSLYKNDLTELKHFLINIDSKKVELQQLVTFTIEQNFAKLEKEDGKILKKVYTNVDSKITSASEVIQQIQPILNEIKKEGIDVTFGGEREQSGQLINDLLQAFFISFFLIFIVLLVNFSSFKNALIIISVIPFTVLGAVGGHFIMGINLNAQSLIGMLGLAGVVINDGIIMLDFLHGTTNKAEFFKRAKQRVRPIFITSFTTVLGLFSIIFFSTGDSVMLQPIAISLGYGIAWGTVLNLIYVPVLYATLFKIKD
ncbi:MAG: HAE1 family hydrophobic/amphiphilic exporter-1 [Sulfurimonas sp.]|jgi:HAE1 family hydrophobic/amphiphilic exporter-1